METSTPLRINRDAADVSFVTRRADGPPSILGPDSLEPKRFAFPWPLATADLCILWGSGKAGGARPRPPGKIGLAQASQCDGLDAIKF